MNTTYTQNLQQQIDRNLIKRVIAFWIMVSHFVLSKIN